MAMDFGWLNDLGVEPVIGMGYTGGPEKYYSALQRFYKAYETNRAKVEETLAGGDLENYRITVHALKSNARMIGAETLSSSFESLESAARLGDKAFIESENGPVMKAYADLVTALAPVGEGERVMAADEISADEAREVAAQLLEALDDFDDDLSAELVKKLSGYPFRLTQKDRLAEAAAFIGDFLYDEAAEIIKEISGEIE